MNIYLTIMVTVLVASQLVRISQNHIQLMREKKQLEKNIAWLNDNEITAQDLNTQRAVYQMLYSYLLMKLDGEYDSKS